ncbi:carbon-nitrogen hydrolase family protein [Hydrogenophaga sp.]|uniref:carbon-nitrogen hydrolase family protein n=1 Tax=Hydrogenophaga sp. TaxID=1904254 RepID=UPI00286E3188|nr:carbon-nitrogen hydrolase family protein [Hydrogenophaga sp.]
MPAADLTLALWQTPYAATTAEALQRLDAAAAQARTQGADLLITPEMALTGYAIGADRVAALAEPADGPLARAVAAIAQRHGIAIVYGYPEQNPQGKPFNAAQTIGPDGTRTAHYRKTHLFGDLDRAQFSAGEAASQVFEWNGWRLGLLICYDVEFPETVRLLALQGADAVLVPTANMVPFDEVQRLLLPARALENRLYLAYANACGQEGGLHYNGLSCAIGPDGGAQEGADGEPRLLLARLDTAALQRHRLHAQLTGRRADLYRPLAQD